MKTSPVKVEHIHGDEKDLFDQMEKECLDKDLQYVLCFFVDCVRWGAMKNNKLSFYSEIADKSSWSTILQFHLFNEEKEIRGWKEKDRYIKIELSDDVLDREYDFDQRYYLWGQTASSRNGFSLLQDSGRGIQFAVPFPTEVGKRLMIRVQHYVQKDEDGQYFISSSRIKTVEEERNDKA